MRYWSNAPETADINLRGIPLIQISQCMILTYDTDDESDDEIDIERGDDSQHAQGNSTAIFDSESGTEMDEIHADYNLPHQPSQSTSPVPESNEIHTPRSRSMSDLCQRLENSFQDSPPLKKGMYVMFKGKGPDSEWFKATLTGSAGKTKGKYKRKVQKLLEHH